MLTFLRFRLILQLLYMVDNIQLWFIGLIILQLRFMNFLKFSFVLINLDYNQLCYS